MVGWASLVRCSVVIYAASSVLVTCCAACTFDRTCGIVGGGEPGLRSVVMGSHALLKVVKCGDVSAVLIVFPCLILH